MLVWIMQLWSHMQVRVPAVAQRGRQLSTFFRIHSHESPPIPLLVDLSIHTEHALEQPLELADVIDHQGNLIAKRSLQDVITCGCRLPSWLIRAVT